MNFKEFDKYLLENLKKEDIKVEENVSGEFWKYMNTLLEWNKNVNLTAITYVREIIEKHFIDSLTILNRIENNKTIVDVGTGAGFPGIPLSIMNPTLKITLVDSLNKRLVFLQEVINQLGLKNVELVHARAEDFGQNKKYREKFDVATSRAVANLSTLSEYLIPLVKVGGKCICMKAANATEEIEQAKKAISVLCGAISKVDEFCLPQSDIGRTIIEIKKEKSTPNKYPRKAGLPSKEPIK